MKKKYTVTSKDKKDWVSYTRQISDTSPKKIDILIQNTKINEVRKLDLHGFSLNESNKKIKKFIIESFNQGYRKILVVTGKGARSKSYDNPYVSEKFSVLKYSIPEFIKNDENLNKKIIRILKADRKDGGEGAIYIFLKNNKKLQDEF